MRKKIKNLAEYIDETAEIDMQTKSLLTQNRILINRKEEASEYLNPVCLVVCNFAQRPDNF